MVWWQSDGSGGGDSLCKGSSCNSCRSTIVKCTLCGGGGGGGWGVVVMVVVAGKTRENTTTINTTTTTRAPQRWDWWDRGPSQFEMFAGTFG